MIRFLHPNVYHRDGLRRAAEYVNNAVNQFEVRLFREPDFSPGCVNPQRSPANKAKPDFSVHKPSVTDP